MISYEKPGQKFCAELPHDIMVEEIYKKTKNLPKIPANEQNTAQ